MTQSRTGRHRRSLQDFLWGALFPQKNLMTFFSRHPQNTGSNC